MVNEHNEENWKGYAACFEDKKVSISGVPNEIVNAVLTIVGDEAGVKWLTDATFPQFDNNTAVELLKTEKGEKALKSFIMRLPY